MRRVDRYYVKRYDDETNLQALLIVDASGSMNFGMSTVSKWRYAQMAAASLAHLLLRQRDSVGLGARRQTACSISSSRSRGRVIWRGCWICWAPRSRAGRRRLPDVLPELTGRLKRRGMVIVLSDCFGDVAALKHVLEQYRFRGHDVIVCQILAPEELTFPFRREAFFQDLELHRPDAGESEHGAQSVLEGVSGVHGSVAHGDDRHRRRLDDVFHGRRFGRGVGVSPAPPRGDEEPARARRCRA